jgi:hypothetical protein
MKPMLTTAISYLAVTQASLAVGELVKYNLTLVDGNKFTIELPPGDRCESDKKKFYTTVYELSCDINVEKLAIDNSEEIDMKKCTNVIKMRSKFGIYEYINI